MSEISVAEGEEVRRRRSRPPRLVRPSTGPHLHYEVRVEGEPVDPERFMRAGRSFRRRGIALREAERNCPSSYLRLHRQPVPADVRRRTPAGFTPSQDPCTSLLEKAGDPGPSRGWVRSIECR